MSRHHLMAAAAAGTALVITGAVFFMGKQGAPQTGEPPAQLEQPVSKKKERWTEVDCPKRLKKLAGAPAHKRRAVCGRLWVPELEGTDRFVEVGVIRLIPEEPTDKSPLLLLAGGPGDAFSNHIERRLAFFGPLARDREILIVDQRGTGMSRPVLECKGKLRSKEELETCFRAWRADLDPGAFNTNESARDIERVLEHHDIGRVSVYGVSYGTRLALTFAALHPDRTELVLLDSPIPYDADVLAEAAANSEQALGRLSDHCNADEQCKTELGFTLDDVEKLVSQMNEKRAGSGDDFLFGLSKLAVEPAVLPHVPFLIHQAQLGKTEFFEKMRKGFDSYKSALGLHLSVQCAEFFALTSSKKIEAGEAGVRRPFREAFSTAGYADQCAGWAVPPQPAAEPPFLGEVPVMILSGRYDPATPPEYGVQLSKALPGSRHVVIESAAHGAATSSCGALVARSFFEAGSEAVLPECVEAPLKFVLAAPTSSQMTQIVREIRYRL